MDSSLLFAYGTLQDSDIQKQLFGKVLPFEEDIIIGYEVVHDLEIEGHFYPRLKEKYKEELKGRVYELTAEQLVLVDEYETDAYYRMKIKTIKNRIVEVYFQKIK